MRDLAPQVTELQELLKAKGLDTKVTPHVGRVLRHVLKLGQGSKAVLVSRLVAAGPAAAAPAPAGAASAGAAAAAPAPVASTVTASSAPAEAAAQAPAPAAATATNAAADDEAARLQRRMEKFGVPASSASDAEAERIKKRGMLQ